MANRPSTCKGKKTDSNCTCDATQCQNGEENNNHKQNNVCAPQCTNCILLNRLYQLLEEIVLNQKSSKTEVNDSKSNGTRKSLRNSYEEEEIANYNLSRKSLQNKSIVEEEVNNIETRKSLRNDVQEDNGTRKSLRNSYEEEEPKGYNDPKRTLETNTCNGTRKSLRSSYEEEEPKGYNDPKRTLETNNYNGTRKSLRSSYEEEEPKGCNESRRSLKNNTIENMMKLMSDYNETNSNKLMFCDCNKRKSKSPSKCVKPQQDQNWQSIGKIKQDFGCQCKSSKQDISTQDDLMGCGSIPKLETRSKKCCEYCNKIQVKKEYPETQTTKKEYPETPKKKCAANQITKKEKIKECFCTDSGVNTEKNIQNLTCLLLNDPNIRETLKLMPCNNIVVLSNGCGCCNKCNTERTSVTTNTSESGVPKKEKSDLEIIIMEDEKNIDSSPRKASVTFKSLKDQELADENQKSRNSDITTLIEDTCKTCCGVPPPQEIVVASAAVITKKASKKSKVSGKSKKKGGKGKKSSDDSMEQKANNICCQTSIKNLPEEACKNVPPPPPPPPENKDVATCCNMEKCQNALIKKESTPKQFHSCNCTDIKNFVSIITEICAQLNKLQTVEKECECKGPSTTKNDCLEIQRLAEQIAEIHLKSRNDPRRSVMPKTTNSDCTLNCLNIMPDPPECKCKTAPKPCNPARKRGRGSVSPKRASKKHNEIDYSKWTQQLHQEMPQPQGIPGKCSCSNRECLEETEIGIVNYNDSDNFNIPANMAIETCPHLHQIVKDCLCQSKNCYCNNPQLHEMKTNAKLEKLADDVINTITPCNCHCTDLPSRRYTTKQVCFSSICPDNPRKIANLTAKEKLFDKDVSGNPCLLGNKLETTSYIRKIANTNPKKKSCHLKKLVPSAKKLKPFIMKPLIPIAETTCPQINCINNLFPEIYRVLSKVKEISKIEILPQEIVEMVIDKILKREIRCALKQMNEGVVRMPNPGDDKQNILNILLDDPSAEEIKEFKNNALDTPRDTPQDTPKSSKHETIKITNPDKDPNSILVQINIDKEEKQKKCPKKIHLHESSLSSIIITEDKYGSIKNLLAKLKNNCDEESIASSIQDELNPISININIAMDKEKRINLKDSFMNTDLKTDRTLISSFSSSENLTKPIEIEKAEEKADKAVDVLHQIQHIQDNLQKSNMEIQKTALSVLNENETEDEMPSVEEFLARNKKMKVKKIKVKKIKMKSKLLQ